MRTLMKKRLGPKDHQLYTLYFETCYVASMVSPGGVVVITPDKRPETWVRVPFGGIQPLFSEEYVERNKDAQILICLIPFIATLVSWIYVYL